MFDNLDLFYIEQRRKDQAELNRPHCYICGEPIWQSKTLKLPSGDYMCDGCIEEHREWTEEEEDWI